MLSNNTLMQFDSISFTVTDSWSFKYRFLFSYFRMFADFCLKCAILILTTVASLVIASCFDLYLFTGSLKSLLY